LGQIDNRGSHFYLAMYWAQELAVQNDDADLKAQFASIAQTLVLQEEAIVAELNGVQRQTVELEGYFNPSEAICAKIMRPSSTFNAVIDGM
jgi:isocitrate dehydrogenase